MKPVAIAIVLLLVVTVLTTAMDQEPKRFTKTISSDDAVIIREIGAVIVPKNDQLIVDIILGNNEKGDSDIQKDDVVMMANGKKVKSVNDLRIHYENGKAGEEFKLGVKRGENLMLVTFRRKSEEELNKAGGHGGMVMRMEQKSGEFILPALGLIFATKKNSVTVIGTLPTLSGNFKSFTPQEGDVIVSMNGTPFTDAEAFDNTYTEMKEGETVTLVFSRNGKELKETFAKPKPMGRKIMMSR